MIRTIRANIEEDIKRIKKEENRGEEGSILNPESISNNLMENMIKEVLLGRG